jgi:hypothetical protein
VTYNAANTKHIRDAKRADRQRENERGEIISRIMASQSGRFYFYDRLVRSHVFETSFSRDGLQTAFNEGERNIGLQDLLDIVRYCPDQYILMMREATDREHANARRLTDSAADGSGESDGRDDSGPGDDLVERPDDTTGPGNGATHSEG